VKATLQPNRRKLEGMNLYADIDLPAVIGVLTGFGLVVVVPLVGMMLSHQRRMAEIMRGGQDQRAHADERIAQLEGEVSQLRQLLADNLIALDDRREFQQRISAPPPPPVQSQNP